ncbi:12930_t:CDS:1, partial [Entrophospora sp. SA101]
SSDLYQDNFDNIAPYIHPDESISQIYSSVQGIVDDDDTATLSNVSVKSTVWEYFDRSPPYAQEYN